MQRDGENRAAFRGLAVKLTAVLLSCVILRAALSGPIPELPGFLGRAALALTLPGTDIWEGSAGGAALGLALPGHFSTLSAPKDKSDTPPAPEPDEDEPAEPDTTPAPKPEEDPGASQEPDPDTDTTTEPEPDTDPGTDNSAPPEDDGTVSTTITGEGGGYTLGAGGIYYKNKTGYDLDIQGLLERPLGFSAGEGAKVLIIHTHSSEAYTPAGEDTYEASDPWRTEDKSKSIIRVGDELTAVLESRGIEVIHDRALYDYPSYTGAYNRSLEAVEGYLREDGDIAVVIDLHRDALEGSDGAVYKTVADLGDSPCAQVMIVCGTDYSGLNHPGWQDNLSFALKLQAAMAGSYPTLPRPLNITQYRYNQHTTSGSLIVEVGTSGNTLQEAINAARYFGQCLADVLGA